MCAHVVPQKGVDYPMVATVMGRVVENLDLLGYKRVIFRGDQEPSLGAFMAQLKVAWSGEVVPELAPTGESQSNGLVERGIQTMEGMIRTLKHALEARIGKELPAEHAVMLWLVEHAAAVWRRFHLGLDDKSAYERLKGKRHPGSGADFGEAVWYMALQPRHAILPKLGARFDEGIFLGIREVSGEIIVGSPEGVLKTRSLKRRPPNERWNAEGVLAI